MPRSPRYLPLLLAAALPVGAAPGTEGDPAAPAAPPARIRQITLPNPVADPLVLANRAPLTPRPADGIVTQLPGVIEVRHEAAGLGYAWDPVECRVLFIWKGGAITDLIYVAEGPSPLAATVGVFGPPQYFGYRLVNGAPEFLYRQGRLAIEERLEPAADGSRLVQRWKVHQSEFDVLLSVPERWKALTQASAGSWSDGYYKVPKASAADLSVTWLLEKPPALPTLPEAWTQALAALPPKPTPAPPKEEAKPAPAPEAAPVSPPPPPPGGPYTTEAISLPADVVGRVAAVEFAPDGRWMLLGVDGHIRIREPARGDGAAAWQTVSDLGLEGASGLSVEYWPKSLLVVHSAGISRLFDTDGDGRIDFVKAIEPVWRYATIGVLFHGPPTLLASGDLLLPPRVASGPLAGSILRFPAEGPPAPWVSGLSKVAAPSHGPSGSWLVAGTRPVGTPPGEFAGIEVIPAPAPAPLPEEIPEVEGAKPAEEGAPENNAAPKENAKPVEGADTKDTVPPAPVEAAGPISPELAIRVPRELLASAPISPAFPPDAAGANFGPFSGQGFLAGETSNRLLRFWLEEVDGAWQGGVTDFATIDSPTPGLGFLRFTPDGGELLAGQNGQLFGIRPAEGEIFAVKAVRLAADGFEVAFTAPVDRQKATDPGSWKLSRRAADQPGAAEEPQPLDPETTRIIVSADGETVTIQAPFAAETVYRFDFSAILPEAGGKISHGPVWYTLHRLYPPPAPAEPEETPVEPAPPPAPAPDSVPTPAPMNDADAKPEA